jgi:hypothetical protein
MGNTAVDFQVAIPGRNLMPNGRSGGFGLNKSTLEHILRAVPADTTIGTSIGLTEVDVSALLRMVIGYPGDVIAIEEQDYRWYIVHLEPVDTESPNIAKWITVSSESPLFKDLRREHLKFEAEKPGQ